MSNASFILIYLFVQNFFSKLVIRNFLQDKVFELLNRMGYHMSAEAIKNYKI